MRTLKISPALAALAHAGCGDSTGPVGERVPGLIVVYEVDEPWIEVPDTVQAGVSFTVTPTRPRAPPGEEDDTEVVVQGKLTSVSPYDFIFLTECAADGASPFTHSATISFDTPGVGSVRFFGRASFDDDTLTSYDREVVVE